MKNILKQYSTAVIVGIWFLFAAGTFIGNCTRNKAPQRAEKERTGIISRDKEKSQQEQENRAKQEALIKPYRDSIRDLKKAYPKTVKADQEAEKKYIAAPTQANGQEVIKSKNERIGKLEKENRFLTRVDSLNQGLIIDLTNALARKDSVIYKMDAGWAKTTQDLSRAVQPKRWGIGLQAGVMPVLSAQGVKAAPYVGAGLSYNIIRFSLKKKKQLATEN